MQPPDAGAPFALLDDATSAGAPCSRWYTGYAGEIVRPPGTLEGLDDALRSAWADGLHALVMAPYEFGRPLVGLSSAVPASSRLPGHDGRLRVLLFRAMQVLSAAEVDALFDAWPEASGAAGLFDGAASVDHDAYVHAIARIQDWVAAGDTYEVNYTYCLRMTAFGAPAALYRRLRARQPVPYGALIELPEGGAILSCSPELFFSHRAGSLVARPMKGTAPASGDPEVDEARAVALAADEKNRAENLMIVDLLRNDLGRLARPGSVRVPALFEVTPYGSVLHMTSTVEAEIPPATGLADCLAALFPCGSITGAPKRRTMEIIDALEPEPRGLYTGAIGWVDAPIGDHAMGDACFSVAIRTLVLGAPGVDGLRSGELGIGSGIVFDSVADEEYAECQLKARFVTALDPGLSAVRDNAGDARGRRALAGPASGAAGAFRPRVRLRLRQGRAGARGGARMRHAAGGRCASHALVVAAQRRVQRHGGAAVATACHVGCAAGAPAHRAAGARGRAQPPPSQDQPARRL